MPQYKVQSGDTLSGIAAQHQVSVNEIKSSNKIITDVNHIETGWTLDIPASKTSSRGTMPAAKAANDASTGESCSACGLECAALLHLTDEPGTVYALTQRQLDEIELEIQELQAPLRQLKTKEEGPEADIPVAREAAWNKLKELGALPAPEKSSTAEEILNEYEAKWALAKKRLDHQKRRHIRIRFEIDRIDELIVKPVKEEHPLLSEQDRLSLTVFTTLHRELKETLRAVKTTVETHEKVAKSRQIDIGNMEKRLKLLRAALEAEISYRLAKSDDDALFSQREQLRIESERLKEATLWPSYIAEPDINTLTERQKKLNELDEKRTPVWDAVSSIALKTSPLYWAYDIANDDDADEQITAQQEYERLTIEQEAMLERLVRTSTPQPMDVVAKPQFGSMRPIVEVKHTGTGGYRYARRETLAKLRENWRPLQMADVKAAMSTGEFERAWGKAKQGLKTNASLKLKLEEWKTSEDNFFYQLEIELVKASASTEDGRFAADAEAQMFRFAAQAGLEASYDPVKQEAYIGGKAEAAYSLLQGQASLKAQLPDAQGTELLLSYEDPMGGRKNLHCGFVRADAEYKIQGFVGACASLAANAKVSSAPGNVGISGETNGEAFAGASVSNEASFAVKWKAAYQIVMGDEYTADWAPEKTGGEFKSLLEVKPEAAVSAGIGVGFDFKVSLSEGKLVLYVKGNLVLGVGGGGGVAAELNRSQVWELIKFIRWSLEQSDFRFLEWVEKEAFEHITFLLKAFAVSGSDFEEFLQNPLDMIFSLWDDLTKASTRVKDTADKVISNPEIATLTPSAKAALLHLLVEDSAPLFGDDPYQEVGAEASVRILKTITSHREFIEVLKCMGNEGRKGDFNDLRQNYAVLILQRVFKSQQASRAEEWLRELYS
jgi:hypothetical protein